MLSDHHLGERLSECQRVHGLAIVFVAREGVELVLDIDGAPPWLAAPWLTGPAIEVDEIAGLFFIISLDAECVASRLEAVAAIFLLQQADVIVRELGVRA